jgi:lysozyme
MKTAKQNGIDISKWQGNIDWDKLAAEYKARAFSFIILRAGYGYATKDAKFEEYYSEAVKRGIPVGAYWYCYWKAGTPEQEAKAFLSAVNGKTFLYGLWCDVEYEKSITSLTKKERTDKTLQMLKFIENAGWYVGLYASADMINNRMEYERLRYYDIWCAQYGSECTCKIPYGMWQHSSKGNVLGISTRVDMDYAYKDYPSIISKMLNGANVSYPKPDMWESAPPTDTVTLTIGPMTSGDEKTVRALAESLGLNVEEE